jgi:hypothetical protein
MKGRPSTLTIEARKRLEREADLVAQRTPYKKLAVELGLKRAYVSNFISRAVRDRVQIKVTKASNSKD